MGAPTREAMVLAVRRTLDNAELPVSQESLAWVIKHTVSGAGDLSLDTARRRAKECIHFLNASGYSVASDRRGYRSVRNADDRAAGKRYLVAQIRGLAERLRNYDSAAGEALLGQLKLFEEA